MVLTIILTGTPEAIGCFITQGESNVQYEGLDCGDFEVHCDAQESMDRAVEKYGQHAEHVNARPAGRHEVRCVQGDDDEEYVPGYP